MSDAVSTDDRRSLEDYLRERVPAEMLPLAKASYSNTLGAGAALGGMPLAAVAALERRWLADGEGDFRLRSGREHATRKPRAATWLQPGCNPAATWAGARQPAQRAIESACCAQH